ncbi:hypothetical protein AVEN_228260-1 [Araneus ventricosus]|uniref:Uncharacterized protein n=1 Tax=Araneus ventricosus TaxID=182803 RepID=A0A4Y2VVL6_ARAVE|nr:hypothetical protein AVEN_228260-1 [Araneus ventricosus]
MTPCRSNNSTSPLPSPLHSCLAEAPMQTMVWAGEARQEQGQGEKVHDYGKGDAETRGYSGFNSYEAELLTKYKNFAICVILMAI